MKKYVVTITEILERSIIVDADNSIDAEDIASDKYRGEDIVLDYNDYVSTSFKTREATNEDIEMYKDWD